MAITTRNDVSAPPERLDPALIKLGVVLILGTIVAVLDATIVGVGVNAIRRDFGTPLATVQWVTTGYLLAFALIAPISGWAAERFGARQVWMTSVALFVSASALCALSWSIGALIFFRVLQGLAGGLIQPLGQAMIAQAAGPSRLGRVMSLLVLPLTFAPLLGPVLGGLILSAFAWPWIFLVNVPIGVVTLVLAARVLPPTPARGDARLDVVGLLLACPGVAALVYGGSEAAASGLGKRAGLAVVAGLLLIGGYVWHAMRYRGTALLDLGLLRIRGFGVAVTVSFLLGAALFSTTFLLPLYYQLDQGMSPLRAGLMLIPADLGVAVSMLFAGKLADRLGVIRPIVLSGIALALLGTIPFALVSATPNDVLLAAALFVRGVGIGATMTPAMTAVFRSVPPPMMPRAAGFTNVLHRLGGSAGVAGLAIVLQRHLAGGSATEGFRGTFWWAFGISAVTLLPVLALPGRKRSGQPAE